MPLLLMALTVPVLVHSLGAAGYGIYALAGSLAAFGGLASLGVGDVTTRAVARALADGADPRPAVRTSLAIGGGLSLLAGALLAALAPLLAAWLPDLDAAERSAASAALAAAGALLALRALDATMHGALAGCERFDLAVRASLPTTAVGSLATIVAALHHAGPWLLILILAATAALSAAIKFAALRAGPMPGLLPLPRLDPLLRRDALRFGGQNALQGLGSLLQNQADRVLLGWLAGPEALAPYAVAVQLAQQIHVAVGKAAAALFPAASRAARLGDSSGLRRTYRRGLLATGALAAALGLPLALAAHPLLALWISPVFADSAAPLLTILAIAYTLGAASAVPFYTLNASGHEALNTRLGWLFAASSAGAAAVAIPLCGALGASLARLIAVPALLLCLIIVDRRLFPGTRPSAWAAFLPAGTALLLAMLAHLLCGPLPDALWSLLVAVAVAPIAGAVAWGAGVRALRE